MPYAPAINMVPTDLLGKSLRETLGRDDWDQLGAPIVASAAGKCDVCHSAPYAPLSAHEEWEYDETASPPVARLVNIEAVCENCGRLEHLDHTTRMVAEEHYPPDAVQLAIAHFCRVNRVGIEDFEAHLNEATARWQALSALKWRIDWGRYARLVEAAAQRGASAWPKAGATPIGQRAPGPAAAGGQGSAVR